MKHESEGVPTYREMVFDAVDALERSGHLEFRPIDVVRQVQARHPAAIASIIRTHVCSRMCANSTDHHAVTYDDLERTGRRGWYRRRALSRYLVAFQASSGLRLTRHVLGPGEGWQLWIHESEAVTTITILDLFRETELGSFHAGLGIEVELTADSIDAAVDAAGFHATFIVTTLAATARAPIGRAEPVIAFQLEGVGDKRDLRRWFRGLPVPPPTRRVDQDAFVALAEKALAATGSKGFALRMSLQLYREAMNEVADIWRFVALWLSLEVLDRPLREHFRRKSITLSGGGQHPGLETLERETGTDPIVRQANTARNDLLHVNEVDGAGLLQRVAWLSPQLETLVLLAWQALLELGTWVDQLPDEPTTLHEVEYVVAARFKPEDGAVFGPGQHPSLVLEIDATTAESQPSGAYALPLSFKVTAGAGMTSLDLISQEIRGPRGPLEMRVEDLRFHPAAPPSNTRTEEPD